ncbi:MAG: hypothetical protein P9E24_12355, partial [Candidatus Competibacter sp.]|nr:hypothetical protein [Candidatus Competibacter sp.]
GVDTDAAGVDTDAAGADTGAAGADTDAAGVDTDAAGVDTDAAGADTDAVTGSATGGELAHPAMPSKTTHSIVMPVNILLTRTPAHLRSFIVALKLFGVDPSICLALP